MAAGVLLYAMNIYFTAALLPSIVGEIGGRQFYAAATACFALAAIVASIFLSRLVTARGVALTYAVAFALFCMGSIIIAASPGMSMLIVGRILQGLGGGLLAGLGYAVIQAAIPEHLWMRATGVISAMWGVGTLLGPVLGGFVGEFGDWRVAYGVLAVVSALLARAARRAFPRGGYTHASPTMSLASLCSLLLAAVSITLSSLLQFGWLAVAMAVASVVLFMLFLAIDRKVAGSVFPQMVYADGNPVKWAYLTMACLSAGVMVESFVPLFGQQLAGLSPFTAGMLGAGLSLTWVAAQLCLSTRDVARWRRLAIIVGPILFSAGLLVYALTQTAGAGTGLVLLWAFGLGMSGIGIGLAWPLLGVLVMGITNDPVEGGKAAAAITITQLTAFSASSSMGGVLLNVPGTAAMSAVSVSLAIALLSAPSIPFAYLALRCSGRYSNDFRQS